MTPTIDVSFWLTTWSLLYHPAAVGVTNNTCVCCCNYS